MTEIHLSTTVVGLPFYQFGDVASYLFQGTQLTLRRDPFNEHDANAIDVLVQGAHLVDPQFSGQVFKLGHINAKAAAVLAPVLDRGDRIEAFVQDALAAAAAKPHHSSAAGRSFSALLKGQGLQGISGAIEVGAPAKAAPKSARAGRRIDVWL